jgi:hypothetical protein
MSHWEGSPIGDSEIALFISGFIQSFQSILSTKKSLLEVLGSSFEIVPSVESHTGTQSA